MILLIDERYTKVEDLFQALISRDGITYIKVYESPVLPKNIHFKMNSTFNKDLKDIIRYHLTDANYYGCFEIVEIYK